MANVRTCFILIVNVTMCVTVCVCDCACVYVHVFHMYTNEYFIFRNK